MFSAFDKTKNLSVIEGVDLTANEQSLQSIQFCVDIQVRETNEEQ